MKVYEPHKSSLGGMDANVMALLTYILGIILSFIPGVRYVAWLVPLIIFFMEKNSQLVKFHAAQAFALYLVDAILIIIIDIIAGIALAATIANPLNVFGAWGGAWAASIIVGIIGLVFLIFAIIAVTKAYKYEEYSIPLFGKIAEKFSAKFNK